MVPGWHLLFRNSAVTAKNAPDMADVCSLGHYNTQTSILHHRHFQHHPLTITSHQRVGVIGCTRRLWRHSSIKPSPPVGCWSILLLRPILRSRLILFQLISINVCVRRPPSSTSQAPLQSSMQMLIRNWCIAGGFKVMTSQGGNFYHKMQ